MQTAVFDTAGFDTACFGSRRSSLSRCFTWIERICRLVSRQSSSKSSSWTFLPRSPFTNQPTNRATPYSHKAIQQQQTRLVTKMETPCSNHGDSNIIYTWYNKCIPGGACGPKYERVTPCLRVPPYGTTPWTLPSHGSTEESTNSTAV